jgi:ABC-type antimicrobial peptide transport system permease subunit
MRDIREDMRAILYFPFGDMREGVFALRLKDGLQERDLARGLRELMAKEFPQVQVGAIRSQKSLITLQMVRERLLAFVATFFAFVALVLAAMGIYGVFSLAVEQRRKEIAIRMALGEDWGATTLSVLCDGLVAAGLGLAGGLAGAFGAEWLMRSLVFGVEPTDLLVIFSTSAVVLVATVLGVAWPLGRALRTDPAMVLRTD